MHHPLIFISSYQHYFTWGNSCFLCSLIVKNESPSWMFTNKENKSKRKVRGFWKSGNWSIEVSLSWSDEETWALNCVASTQPKYTIWKQRKINVIYFPLFFRDRRTFQAAQNYFRFLPSQNPGQPDRSWRLCLRYKSVLNCSRFQITRNWLTLK